VSLVDNIRAAAEGADLKKVALGAGIFVVSLVGSIALTSAVLVRLPPDYLTCNPSAPRQPLTGRALALRIGRCVAGVLLIALGIVLSFPGVPGQGFLTIIAGLFISELPGTRRLLRRILSWPRMRSAVNKLRARYKHPPLEEPCAGAA
jgi:hypothetical protein